MARCTHAAILNTAVAESMGVLADAIEGGTPTRDAVAEMLKTHWNVVFNGDGYSDEWPIEAAARGLPNLKNTVDAVETLCVPKNEALFEKMKVFTPKELHARQEIMFEKYTNDLTIEASCLVDMMQTGVLAACAQDLALYSTGMSASASKRSTVYQELESSVEQLSALCEALPEDGSPHEQARYCVDVIKPQMESVRALSDTAEGLVQKDLWPYPKYKDILYQHHYE